MNPTSVDIAHHIESFVIEPLCYVSEEPADPNNTVTIYDTGGSDPVVVGDLYAPTIQIRVRNLDYESAYQKMQAIVLILCVPKSFTINDTNYVGVWQQGDIISLGKDQNNRYILTANFRIERHANG